MSGQRHLPQAVVDYFERQLAQHYGERVAPVSAYCDAFRAWHQALAERIKREDAGDVPRDQSLRRAYEALNELHIPIMKSSMLGRLIYGGERLRTQMCSEHNGQWVGLPSPGNDCACDLTGWLPHAPTSEGKQ